MGPPSPSMMQLSWCMMNCDEFHLGHILWGEQAQLQWVPECTRRITPGFCPECLIHLSVSKRESAQSLWKTAQKCFKSSKLNYYMFQQSHVWDMSKRRKKKYLRVSRRYLSFMAIVVGPVGDMMCSQLKCLSRGKWTKRRQGACIN